MPANPLFTRKALELYKQEKAPVGLFTSFYDRKPPTDQILLSQDIVRSVERIALDVVPGTGPKKIRKLEPFTNKEFTPPEYDEAFEMTAAEFNKRIAGQNAYDPVQKQARLIKFIAEAFKESRWLIERAIEKQCVDAVLTGQITLSDGSIINFFQKATHKIAGVDWSSAATDIIGDVKKAADVIRQDGLSDPNTIIMAEDMMEGILSNTALQARINLRRVDIAEIGRPQMRDTGGIFHGVMAIGSYSYNLWTYPQIFVDASDVSQLYIPAGKAIVLDDRARFDLNFGAIHRFTKGNSEGTQLAGMQLAAASPVEFHEYAFMDERGVAIQAGQVSRPLAIPTAIDKVAVITSA